MPKRAADDCGSSSARGAARGGHCGGRQGPIRDVGWESASENAMRHVRYGLPASAAQS